MEERCCNRRECGGYGGKDEARTDSDREYRFGPLIKISGVADDEGLADAKSLDQVDECNKRQSERNQAEVPRNQKPRQDGNRDQREQAAAKVGPVRPEHGTHRPCPNSCRRAVHSGTAVQPGGRQPIPEWYRRMPAAAPAEIWRRRSAARLRATVPKSELLGSG